MSDTTRIVLNAAECLNCFDLIVSENRHDYVTCSCGDISVDGGRAYFKRGFKNLASLKDVSIIEKDGKYFYASEVDS